MESKKTSRALNNGKKPTTVSRKLRTGARLSEIKRAAEEQCVEPLFEGDEQLRRYWTSCGRCQSRFLASGILKT